MARIKDVDPDTLKAWMDAGDAVLIDVREREEYDQENIPGAILQPLSLFDVDQVAGDRDKIAVFHCRSGTRTVHAGPLFMATNFRDVYHLAGGIIDWKKKGYPTRSGGG